MSESGEARVDVDALSFGGAPSKHSSDSDDDVDDQCHLSGDEEGELSASENSWLHPPQLKKDAEVADKKFKIPKIYFAGQSSKYKKKDEKKTLVRLWS